MVIDLSAVTFVDSTGIAWLLNARRRWPNGGLALCCPPGPPRRVLQITGLVGLLPLRETMAEAIAAIATAPHPVPARVTSAPVALVDPARPGVWLHGEDAA